VGPGGTWPGVVGPGGTGTGTWGGLYPGGGAPCVGGPGTCPPGTGGAAAGTGDATAHSSADSKDGVTQLTSSAQGRFGSEIADTKVSGSYSGTGTFSASAQTGDANKSSHTIISGSPQGSSSVAKAHGGIGQAHTNVNVGAHGSGTTATSISTGQNYNTNTRVHAGLDGGKAESQSQGSGITESRAQIGFRPVGADNGGNDRAPYRGGGSATSHSGASSGMSQADIQGSYQYGITYTGSAQAAANRALPNPTMRLQAMQTLNTSFSFNDSSSEHQIFIATRNISSVNPSDVVDVDEDPVRGDTTYKPPVLSTSAPVAVKSAVGTGDDYEDTYDEEEIVVDEDGSAPDRGDANDDRKIIRKKSARKGMLKSADIRNGASMPSEFIAVTKSASGKLGSPSTNTSTSTTYYSKSSTCGYFSFTCSEVNSPKGRAKICKPNLPTNTDGSPCA